MKCVSFVLLESRFDQVSEPTISPYALNLSPCPSTDNLVRSNKIEILNLVVVLLLQVLEYPVVAELVNSFQEWQACSKVNYWIEHRML